MIRVFGLNRSELIERRQAVLSPFEPLKAVFLMFLIKHEDGSIQAEEFTQLQAIRDFFIEETQPTAEHSVLKKAFIGGIPDL